MSYQTGTGATITDLLDALRLFAIGEGWTVDKWDTVNKVLFMTKGLCSVTMGWDTTPTFPVYSGANGTGVLSNQPNHTLYMALGTSNNAALTTYWGHPGSPVTSFADNDRVSVNGLTGPFVAWHFFADATVSDHIHVVIQLSAEVYQHFSIGHVDKKGLTHSGVAYVHGNTVLWARNVSQYNPTFGGTNAMNWPTKHSIPFIRGNDQGQDGAIDGFGSIILKNSDAWPAAWNGPIASRNGAAPQAGVVMPLMGHFNAQSEMPSNGFDTSRLLNCAHIASPTSYSNQTVLFPIPVFRSYTNSGDSTQNRVCYLGDFPNVRYCNMKNLSPGQEITFGTDTYKVFPACRYSDDASIATSDKPTTGQAAIAYKKV